MYLCLFCYSSRNILLDDNVCAKICDFGFSVQLPERKANRTMITAVDGLPGTDGYRPPEYGDRKYSVLSDVYSYGVVYCCLWTYTCKCIYKHKIPQVVLESYTGLLAFSDERDANNLVRKFFISLAPIRNSLKKQKPCTKV